MPSTYTLNNGIELIGTGEQSGTWGDTTNTNFELLDTALDGQVSVTLAATGSSGSPNTLPISDGASSNGRNRLVIFGDGGDLGGTAFVQLTPNDAEKIIYVRNNLSGSRSILLFQGTYNASNDYEVPAGTTAVVFFNGAGSGAVAANVFNNAHFDALNVVGSVTVGGGVTVTGTVDAGTVEFDNLSGTGAVSVTNILDEDNMASNSATALSTQQSIKAYVDSQVGTVDTLAEILANGNTTGGTDISVSTGDDITFADNSKAIFGAGSDLQIYHDGNSKITDVGDGKLELHSNGTGVTIQKGATEYMAQFLTDGAVTLYYDNASKLATTATGVAITGGATFSGTSNFGDGNELRFGADNDLAIFHSSGVNNIRSDLGTLKLRSDDMRFTAQNGTSEFARFDSSGNFGIGVAAPTGILSISGADTTSKPQLRFMTGEGTGLADAALSTTDDSGGTGLLIGSNLYYSGGSITRFSTSRSGAAIDFGYTGSMKFYTGSGNTAPDQKMTLDSSGNLQLTSVDQDIEFNATTGAHESRLKWNYGGTLQSWIEREHSDGSMVFGNQGSEAMRIDSGGNVGIGVTPSDSNSFGIALDVGSTTGGALYVRDTGGSKVGIVGQFNEQLSINSKQSDGNIGFYTGASNNERMRITSTGSVGIGTSSVTAGFVLEGIGDARFGDAVADDAVEIGWSGGGGYAFVQAFDRNATAQRDLLLNSSLHIDSSGNVSISSTDAEGAKLKVADTQDAVTYPLFLQNRTNTGNSAVGIRFIATGSSVSDGQFAAIRATNALGTGSTANDLEFLTCGSGGTPAVRMRIDSSGDVIINHNTNNAKLEFKDQSNSTGMMVQQIGASGAPALRIYDTAAGSERMRIDSSGNLLVGKTSSGLGNTGHEFGADGYLYHTRAGDVMWLNRTAGSSGTLLTFMENGGTVGRIHSRSTDYLNIQIGSLGTGITGTSTHTILPSVNNARSNNTNDLGNSVYRWKDLYLAGGVYLGGVGSANKLTDYEEGSYQPTVYGATTAGSTTLNSSFSKLHYTKIGRQVTIGGEIRISGSASGSGILRITTPFTNINENGSEFCGAIGVWGVNHADGASLTTSIAKGADYLRIIESFDNASSETAVEITDLASNAELTISITFLTS